MVLSFFSNFETSISSFFNIDENLFSNFSFLFLFLSMILYWWRTFFLWNSPQPISVTYYGANLFLILGNISLFFLLLFRWKLSGHFPLSNLYESLIFLSWNLTTILIIYEKFFIDFYKTTVSQKENNKQKINNAAQQLVSSILSSSALLTQTFATVSLPLEMQKAKALLPALQSNWLIMHVTVMILSYATLIAGCLLSIAFLIVTGGNEIEQIDSYLLFNKSKTVFKDIFKNTFSLENLNKKDLSVNNSTAGETLVYTEEMDSSFVTENLNKKEGIESLKKKELFLYISGILDNLSYRILGIGFPFLTLGILSGAVWANEAWGSYWSWDPKETWALLTWLVFAIYLHTRYTKGWQGKKPAIIASFGFVLVWVCFLGVNLLGKGLHSYGWYS